MHTCKMSTSRTPTRTAPEAGTPSTSSLSPEEQGYQEVGELLGEIGQDLDQDSGSDLELDGDHELLRKRLSRNVWTQERLKRAGPLVGQKAKPIQMARDAHYCHTANTQTIPNIRNIKISSVWDARSFTRRLRTKVTQKYLDPEQYEEEQSLPSVDETFVTTLVDDYFQEVSPGLVPSLSTVYGSQKLALRKPKPPAKLVQKAAAEKEPLKKPNEEKQTTIKNTRRFGDDSDMEEDSDPTVKRVEALFNSAVSGYERGGGNPICLMSLLLDKASFHKTVENYYCFTFLLKDNRLRMYLDDCNLPVVKPTKISKISRGLSEQEEGADLSQAGSPTKIADKDEVFQTVMMNLTEKGWKRLVAEFATKDNC